MYHLRPPPHERFRPAVDGRPGIRSEIALAAGYYDQAHFSAEFRAHAGLTPGAYRRARRYPGTTSLAAGAEQFFQDTAV